MLSTYAALADRILAAPPLLGPVRLVLVDGPAGSGKTTFAGRLAGALGQAPVVHLDDLYDGWSGLRPDLWRRLHAQVLEPLADGRPGSFQRYDWAARRFDGWHDVPLAAALIVEGVGAAARAIEGAATLRVWVEATRDKRLARGIARDGEQNRPQWLRWSATEDAHFRTDGTKARADILVDGQVDGFADGQVDLPAGQVDGPTTWASM